MNKEQAKKSHKTSEMVKWRNTLIVTAIAVIAIAGPVFGIISFDLGLKISGLLILVTSLYSVMAGRKGKKERVAEEEDVK